MLIIIWFVQIVVTGGGIEEPPGYVEERTSCLLLL